jgi:hypothetical protein
MSQRPAGHLPRTKAIQQPPDDDRPIEVVLQPPAAVPHPLAREVHPLAAPRVAQLRPARGEQPTAAAAYRADERSGGIEIIQVHPHRRALRMGAVEDREPVVANAQAVAHVQPLGDDQLRLSIRIQVAGHDP